MQKDLQVVPLTDSLLDQTTTAMLTSFLTLNPSWKSYGYSLQQLYPYVRTKIQSIIPGGQSTLLLSKGQVIAGILADDILSVHKTLLLPFDLSLFDRSKLTGRYLQKYLPLTPLKPGEAQYVISVFVVPDESNRGLFLDYFLEFIRRSREQGYKCYYSLASNPRFTDLSVGLGADVLAEMQQGTSRLSFVRLDYDRVQLGRPRKENIKPRL